MTSSRCCGARQALVRAARVSSKAALTSAISASRAVYQVTDPAAHSLRNAAAFVIAAIAVGCASLAATASGWDSAATLSGHSATLHWGKSTRFPPALVNGGPRALHHLSTVHSVDESTRQFVRSVAWHGNPVILLDGRGADTAREARAEGWDLETRSLSDVAAALPPGDLVLVTGSADVVVLRGHQAALGGYQRAMQAAAAAGGAGRKGSVLLSAQRSCPSPGGCAALSRRGGPEFAFPSAAGMMGPAADVARLLQTRGKGEGGEVGGQALFARLYSSSLSDESLPLVVLDHDNEVFLVLSGSEERWGRSVVYDPGERVWRHQATRGTPAVFTAVDAAGQKDAAVAWDALQGRYCSDVTCAHAGAPLVEYVRDNMAAGAVLGGALGVGGTLLWRLLERGGVTRAVAPGLLRAAEAVSRW